MNSLLKKQTFVYEIIFEFLAYDDQLRMQLISKRFYEKIIPKTITQSRVLSQYTANSQQVQYQYASGLIMYFDPKNLFDENLGNRLKQDLWQHIIPSNQEYVNKHQLDKQLRFGRTVYVPHQRIIVISGQDVKNQQVVKDVFQFHLPSKKMEILPQLYNGRTSFSAHYNMYDRFIYVIGGCNQEGKMMRECEKFDVYELKWHKMKPMNEERGNPATLISSCKKYLYAFYGFKDVFIQNGKVGYKESRAISSIERIDLQNKSSVWEVIQLKNDCFDKQNHINLMPKGSFVMHPIIDIGLQKINNLKYNTKFKNNEYEQNLETLSTKFLVFGGWRPYKNQDEIHIYDSEAEAFCEATLNYSFKNVGLMKKVNSMNSASTAHESQYSDTYFQNGQNQINKDDYFSDDEFSSSEDEDPIVKFRIGDKFTKKPIQIGKNLVLLGRSHIQLFDLESFQSQTFENLGEDFAEQQGNNLKLQILQQ